MEINLDGGEIQIIKALGFGGTPMDGETLLEKIGAIDDFEFLDSLKGLITTGFVNSDKQSLHNLEDVERANFSVNTGYSRDLRDALDPRRKKLGKPSRRVRRE
jgi:hypothetical protein